MSTQYQVVWPYATVKLIDGATGQPTFRGFNEGSVLPLTADANDVKRLVGKGAVAALGEQAPPAVVLPDPEPDVEPAPDVKPERPKDYAPKPEWVDYAVACRAGGVSEEDARVEAEGKPKADLITEFGS